ncbi:MAG: TRAP transporter large permease subunit [Rhodospirillales bacterium]|nr:TRAP transporter large permease subunit [Rhodospirillales bacterium]
MQESDEPISGNHGSPRFRAFPGPGKGALLGRLFDRCLEGVCLGLLVATVAIALTQVFFRYGLNASLSWPEEMARWAFVWLVFVGMAVNTQRRSHISIDFLSTHLPALARPYQGLLVRTAMATISIALLVHGTDLVSRSTYVSPALEWPFKTLYLAIPVGAALTLLALARQREPGDPVPAGGVLACALGAGLYFLVRYWGADLLPGWATSTTLVATAVVLIVLGVPVAFALAFGAFAAFSPQGELLLLTVPQYMTAALDSFILLAIPFFILAAGLMNVSGITGRLVDLATRLVGHLRGGLGQVNVLTNTMMAGLSGSSMADAAAIAKVMVPGMEARGYPRPFSCALTSAAAVLANLIPPSLGLIIYGALASASVGALFVAAIMPGLLVAVTLAVVVHVMSIRRGFGRDTERASGSERLRALWRALPALILPVLIVGGVRFGVFTATEAGAVAVLYALVCGTAFYRQMSWAGTFRALRESLFDTVAVMIIIAAASPFAWILVTEQLPQRIAQELGVLATSPFLLLAMLNVFLLVVGLIMEMIAAMVILVPIFIPIVTAAGIDPIHFGVVLVVNLVIGALTPPLGMLVFTTARVGEARVVDVFKAIGPFLVGLLCVLALITYFPAISLTLTRIIGP